MGEHAPRDLVARAILHEMEVSRAKDPFVYLDLTHLNAKKVEKRFPRIYAACMQHNIDITEDMIPVRPAAHFCVGGVRTSLDGKTTVCGTLCRGRGRSDRAPMEPTGCPATRFSKALCTARALARRCAKDAKVVSRKSVRTKGCILERARGCRRGRLDREDTSRHGNRCRHRSYAHGNAAGDQNFGRDDSETSASQNATSLRSCESASGEPARSTFRSGPRREPRRPLPNGLSRSRRQEVPEAFGGPRRKGRLPLGSVLRASSVYSAFFPGNSTEAAIEISNTPATTASVIPTGTR